MDPRRAALLRIGVYAALMGTAFVDRCWSPAGCPPRDEGRDFGESLGDWAAFAYVPLFVLANFLISWPILAGAGGLLFGTAAATPLALAAVTLAVAAFRWRWPATWRANMRPGSFPAASRASTHSWRRTAPWR